MKKILIFTAIFMIAAATVSASKVYLIQGTYLSTTRTFTDGVNDATHKYGEAGINFTTFQGHGIGFFSTATFLMPISYALDVNGINQSSYTKESYLDYYYDSLQLGLDMNLGVGFMVPIGPQFSLLAGGGLHFNGIILFSSNVDNYLSYVLGPGATVTAMMNLTPNLNINASASAAWDMLEIIHMPDLSSGIDFKNGFTWSVSAGLGFKY